MDVGLCSECSEEYHAKAQLQGNVNQSTYCADVIEFAYIILIITVEVTVISVQAVIFFKN